MKVFYFVLLLCPYAVLCEDSCIRPPKLEEIEETCKTDPEVTGNSGTFLEQLQENIAVAVEQTKRLINIAKKKLGIKYDEQTTEEQIKKCEYYQCIFRKMDSLGITDYPNMTLMETWINNNIDESMKEATIMKMYSCFNAIAINIAKDDIISTYNLKIRDDTKMVKLFDNITDHDMDTTVEDNLKTSTACDISSRLMMCLNTDGMCSTFKYP